MGVERWRMIKGLLYVIAITTLAGWAITEDATILGVASMVSVLLIYGVQLDRIKLSDKFVIEFRERN